MVKVDADFGLWVIGHDHAHVAVCGLGHDGVHVCNGHGFTGLECQINGRDVWCGHAHRGAVQFACQFGQNLAQCSGSTRGCWDQRHSGCAGAVKVFMAAVQGRLVASVAVDRCHDPALDADGVVEDFC